MCIFPPYLQEDMIQTKNITFSYPNVNFHFPDITVSPGKALLITGGSGKGKTTLLHLLGGLLAPQTGGIQIGSTQIGSLSSRAMDQFRGANIGLVLQQSYFIAALSVLENIVLASWLATGRKEYEKARVLLSQLDLEAQAEKLPSQLSIGQQQRVSIARALINDPKLLLADEPTSSLDDENAAKVASLLTDLSAKHQASLIIVTHDQRLKDRFENHISLL